MYGGPGGGLALCSAPTVADAALTALVAVVDVVIISSGPAHHGRKVVELHHLCPEDHDAGSKAQGAHGQQKHGSHHTQPLHLT